MKMQLKVVDIKLIRKRYLKKTKERLWFGAPFTPIPKGSKQPRLLRHANP